MWRLAFICVAVLALLAASGAMVAEAQVPCNPGFGECP
jgi:hypothetical protein